MTLYLVQHGQAKPESEDPDRPLTVQGIDDVSRVARHAIETLGVRATKLLHSGKTRAQQTAEIWAAILGAEIEEVDGLAPNDDPAIWAGRVGTDTLVLVGHMPHLGRLAGLLLTGDADRQVVRLQPGCLIGLERAGDDGWVVSLALPPRNG